eukprot:g21094.t1
MGCVVEFCGDVFENMSMEARMSVCNMTIEAGARAGMVAPDETTFNYLKGRHGIEHGMSPPHLAFLEHRPLCPKGKDWDKAVEYWKSLRTDKGAKFDKDIHIDAADIAPTVTWGTSPEDVVPITGIVPDPSQATDETKRIRFKSADRTGMLRALQYMGLEPGTKMQDITIQKVFIGSAVFFAAPAMALNLESFRLKDPLEWTPRQVQDFLTSILPGHPCLGYFHHTSGYVLCSLEKEDLRKQTKSDEAKATRLLIQLWRHSALT